MSIICWNARGLGNPRAFRRFRFAIRKSSPSLVFVSETKLSSFRISDIRSSLGFDNAFGVNSDGSRGGLAIFWQSDWNVQLKSFGPGHIDTLITDNEGMKWRFTGFYGHPVRRLRHLSWELIRRLHSMYSLPWVIGGDFNEIMHVSEKFGGVDRCHSSMTAFGEVLNSCELLDLGFEGPHFTWNNNQVPPSNIQERLDRFVATLSWKSMFTEAKVMHMDFYGSDHRMLKIDLYPPTNSATQSHRRNHSFRFEPLWQTDGGFKQALTDSWMSNVFPVHSPSDLKNQLQACGQQMKIWGQNKFGNLPKKINNLQKQISQMSTHTEDQENRQRIQNLEYQLDYLLGLEESYWKQRSRTEWLASGDRNTTFFHQKASTRRRNNRIKGVMTRDNVWITNEKDVRSIFLEYFNNLFTTSSPSNSSIDQALLGMEGRISENMRTHLDAPYSSNEIRAALFGMAPWKAPGPDGFHAGFFQTNWDLVGSRIISVCLRILNENISLGDLNTTYLVLIPKTKNPTLVTEYRPISLCNVMAKIVAKTIANRLKFCLQEIIDMEQSAFVPGRLITDNILVAFKCLHTIKRRTRGRKGLMAIKLDMNKAYDRVEWDFLGAIMSRMGFSNCWTDRIMDYLHTTRFSILINGQPSEYFSPSRGLRQGCPLSPYLFLICSQGLSSLLKQRAALGELKGISCARNAPEITHLFFADDTLLFGQVERNTSIILRNILQRYESASGQSVNLHKSSITFSPNSSQEMKDQTFSILGLQRNESYEAYLGLPAFTGRSKQRIFDGIKERVWRKLQGWKSKLFSVGGREILIKAVAQAIPSYTMSIFRMPVILCQRLKAMITNFWWGSKGDEKRIHWRKWSLLCRPKSQGGMGFRDIIHFNQALLAKQVWRLLANPNSLAARLFQTKYFPSHSLLQAKLGHNPSYVWRSLLWGRELLAKGIRWRIAKGSMVSVFRDPWLLRPKLFKPITVPNQEQSQLMVGDLMTEGGDWDWIKVNNTLWDVDRDEVKRIPVVGATGEDKIVWHYTPKGEYTVKSGYFLAHESDETGSNGLSCGFTGGLQKLWNLRIPNKIKIHGWRSLFNALPVRCNLFSRGIKTDVTCPRCNSSSEDVTHVFWFCKTARKMWKLTNLWSLLTNFKGGSFGDLFQWVVENGQGDNFENFVLICWSLWIDRNQLVFQGKSRSCEEVLSRAMRTGEQYRTLAPKIVSYELQPTSIAKWSPPSEDVLKVNVDAAVIDSADQFGVGIVGRDNHGHVIFAEGRVLDGRFTPHMAEMIAIKEGSQRAKNSGWSKWVVETDAFNTIHAILSPSPFAMDAPIAENIRSLCSGKPGDSILHCPRNANQVANELARRSLHSRDNLVYLDAIPMFLKKFVIHDLLS